jgi:uncharacterized protein
MALEISESQGRLLLRLRVSPGARKARINGEHDGALKLSVQEPAEKGKANEGVIRLLARSLDIPEGRIELINGHASRDKRVAIKGTTEDALQALVE